MQLIRLHRRIAAWLAAAAMLLLSLVPTLSHTLQTKAKSDWLELCTAVGVKWVEVAPGSQPKPDTPLPEPSPAHVLEHCPYCALQAQGLGPAATADASALLDLDFEVPCLSPAAPRTLHVWLAAQPRGPPVFS